MHDISRAPPVPTADLIEQLQVALGTRTVIAQATGLLAARFAIGTDRAWRLLREVSNLSNQKLVRVARLIVDLHDGVELAEDEKQIAGAVRVVFDSAVRRAGLTAPDRDEQDL